MLYRSPYRDVEIPEIPLTEAVLRRAEDLADKPALIDAATGRAMTYGELRQAVRRAAAGLAARGFRKGDVFAIFSPNLPEYAVAFLAVAMLGGINTTINPVYTDDELAYQLKDAGAKYLLTVPQLMDKALEGSSGSAVQEIFAFGEAEGATPFAALLEHGEDVPNTEINPLEDIVALPYSSGTTGVAKGVMLTHYNMVANLFQLEEHDCTSERDTLIAVLPFFHIYGMNVIMNLGLFNGATIVVMQRFDLEQFLSAMQTYRVTRAHLVPPIILALAKHPVIDSFDLSNLELIMSGAAPLGENLSAACCQRLGCVIKQGYGLTETSPVTHMCSENPAEIKNGSIGQCIPSTECKVVHLETGEALGVRQEGELYIRGPQVMKGYLNRPENTAQTIDEDGWLHTGDIGYADEEGHFFIVDRAKELIKYKGFQVAPAELEAVLLSHPAVADAAVIPCADEEAGEVPKAFVVLKGEASAAELQEYVAARVAPYKKIRHLEFIEQIPKSPSGKILRRVLVQKERQRKENKLMSPEVISRVIKAYFAATRSMDMEAWIATFAPDATSYDPVGAPPTTGHDALRQFFGAIVQAFDRVGFTEEHIFIAGNGAAVKWTGQGKGKNGRDVRFEGIDIFELNEEGLIQTIRAYWNPAEVMMQLQG